MNIQQLIDRATAIDPKLTINVRDDVQYAAGKKPERTVTAYVHHRDHGEGSHENILFAMVGVGDTVVRVEPGSTTCYWQAAALVQALSESTVREDVRDREDVTHR